MLSKLSSIINTVLVNRGKSQSTAITGATLFRDDLGFDSLDLAELTVRVEAEYDIDIFADNIVNTVGEVLQKIGNK